MADVRRLTVKRVRGLVEPGRYFDGEGLYLQVLSPTNRSWLLRYQLHGKERWLGGGSALLFSLPEAREWAREQHRLLARGIDPLEHKREERARLAVQAARSRTFEQVTTEFFDAHQASWSSAKHRDDFLASVRIHVFPTLGSLPVRSIDDALVLSVLKPIWGEKTETARRLRQRVESVLEYAKSAGYREGDNPARWKGHLENLLPKPSKIAEVEHRPALPYAELPAFMAELRKVEGIAARALEFAVLTASRAGEVIKATWSEIDLEMRVWTRPPEHMKARKEHRVPLSTQAVKLLRSLPREAGNGFVFIGTQRGASLGENAMLNTLKALRKGVTVAGFRSTFRVWGAERTNYPRALLEQCLAHVVGSKVERAYQRSDLLEQRVQPMQAWSDYCGSPPVAAEVTPLRRRG